MKIRFCSAFMVFVTLFSMQQLSAYWYDYSNHTKDPLKIRMKLGGDDRWYEAILAPKSEGAAKASHIFKFGPKDHTIGEAEWWKGGLCFYGDLQVQTPIKISQEAFDPNGTSLGIVKELKKDTQGNIVFGPWADVAITYVKTQSAGSIINAAAALADSVQTLTQDIAGAAVKYKEAKAEAKK
jgi:hypothetical protein